MTKRMNRVPAPHRIRGLAALAVVGLLAIGSAIAAEPMALSNARADDIASVQRGAKLFFNYCSGCHSLQYLRYSRIGSDLGLTDKEVESNLILDGAKIGDLAISHMPEADAQKWFGKAPPDLSLEARVRGTDWIYNYLRSFYLDPSRPLGWNNTVFPDVSMPNPLWELQGLQVNKAAGQGDDGAPKLEIAEPGRMTPAAYDKVAHDISAFLQYAGEPAALKRQSIGVWVILFLVLFSFLALLLKHEYWKDVH